jgi:polyketide biosynthesis acyl carrier protein
LRFKKINPGTASKQHQKLSYHAKASIFKIIVGHLCEVLPEINPEDVSMSDSLHDLGAGSIDRADIVVMTMESLSLDISLVELAGARNIEGLVDVFYAKLPAAGA